MRDFVKRTIKSVFITLLCVSSAFNNVFIFAQDNKYNSDIEENDSDISLAATETAKTIVCYADIDEAFVEVGRLDTAYLGYNWLNRPYVTATQLETVYSDYGFKTSDLDNNKYLFPNTVPSDSKQIWADMPAVADGSDYKIAIAGSSNTTTYLYYLPKNVSGSSSYFTNKKSINDATMLSENAFYSISVEDSTGSCDVLPDTQYVLNGNTFSVTLPSTSEYIWTAVNNKTGDNILDTLTTTDNGDGTVTYSGTVTCPIKFKTVFDGLTIKYNTDLTNQIVSVGQISSSAQSVYVNGSIDGEVEKSYIFKNSDDTYTLLEPDNDYAETSTSNSLQKYFYNFNGWKISNNIYRPGDTLTKDELNSLATDGVVDITAIWTPYDQGFNTSRMISCNFFVQLNSEIADSSGSASPTPKTNYSNAVYTTRVSHTGEINKGSSFTLIEGESGENAYAVNSTIRSLDTIPYGDYELLFDNIPTDEEVLASIRNDITNNGKTVYVEGKAAPASDVTTKNFTIRWYVVKYDGGDGWHIDGILVTKAPKFAIKKTFNGEDDVVDSVKENFSITVSHGTVTDHTLNLNEKSASNKDGYDYYDSTTDSYYWIINGLLNTDYSVTENNYKYTGSISNIVSTHQYRFTNTDDSTYEWLNYTSAVNIAPEAYESDVSYLSYKTAEFQNTYIKKSTLVIHKIGDVSSDTMKNVEFTLKDDSDITLYQKSNTSHYSFTQNSEYTDSSATLKTDSNGNIYLHLPETAVETTYTYDLIETIPTGYKGAYGFRIVVKNDGTIISVNEIDKEGDIIPDSKWVSYDDSITIKNSTAVYTEATVKKQWNTAKDSDKVPVVVELWRNGVKIPGTQYTQTLSQDNDWQYTWNDLPVYMNGELAQYSIKEIQVGNTYYSSEYDDGYKDYIVTYDANLYWNDASETHDTPVWQDSDGNNCFADHLLVVVENMPDISSVVFTKTDPNGKALEGAVFGLYSDSDCTKELATATSTSSGLVAFTNIKNGTYYIKEIQTPKGYGIIYDDDGNVPIHKAIIRNKKTTITDSNGNVITSIQNQSLGDLIIMKNIAGNAGDKSERFSATVTLEANETPKGNIIVSGGENNKTITSDDWNDGKAITSIVLDYDTPVTILGIPYGTSYSVIEDATDISKKYAVSYENSIGTILQATTNVLITNTKNIIVPTESTPSDVEPAIILLIISVLLGGFLIYRKRKRFLEREAG